jgi:putative ABC transport system substrate-binding protein
MLRGQAMHPTIAQRFSALGRTQQPAPPVIGVLLYGAGARPLQDIRALFQAQFQGLSEMGYVEGRNMAVEFHTTDQYDQLPALATDLVRRKVAVIYAQGSATAAMAAKAATTTIPIVFSNGSDPIRVGLVPSLSRPGGNITGVTYFISEVVAQRLQHLRELVPAAAAGTIGFLTNPTNLISKPDTSDMLAAAQRIGQQIRVLTASTVSEIDAAFAAAAEGHLAALIVDGDALFNTQHDRIVALAARHRIPSTYPARVFVDAGGLISYGDNRRESGRQAGIYIGRILKGDKPSDLPVLQPTKFDLVINLKTAKALGLTIPESHPPSVRRTYPSTSRPERAPGLLERCSLRRRRTHRRK